MEYDLEYLGHLNRNAFQQERKCYWLNVYCSKRSDMEIPLFNTVSSLQVDADGVL